MTLSLPLPMQPVFRDYPWGGTRLRTALGKAVPPPGRAAESWEIADRGPIQSRVADGPLVGLSLGELYRTHGADLLGAAPVEPRFPLMFKWLDTAAPLSVQIHPGDADAARLGLDDLGKTEAWYVLAARPDSRLYVGLKPGVGRAELAAAVAAGRVAECLNERRPLPGETYLVRPGTVHALGAGLLVAEIQTNSDLTYRLFDWNRTDDSGRPRPLHVPQALELLDETRGPIAPGVPTPLPETSPRPSAKRHLLAECEHFRLERLRIEGPTAIGGDGRMRLLAIAQGSFGIDGLPGCPTHGIGAVLLCPAAMRTVVLLPYGPAEVLSITLPVPG